MPQAKRRARQRRGSRDTPRNREWLLGGHDFEFLDTAEPATQDELRELWRAIGNGLVAEHIAENPGSRPWGWWEFAAPEQRRRIDGPAHPFDNPGRQARITELLWYGRPARLVVADDFAAEYESETAYLQRLGLLAAGESGRKQQETPDKWVRSDMDRLAVEQGCWFDPPAAERVRTFFGKFLRHSKGEWAGQRFELLPWQWDDVVVPLFGWKRADGTRRYRKGYIEVAKKNGKSTLCAGLSLYLLVADDEPGAEVYSAAADREQASIIFREAASMVRASTELSGHIQVVPSMKRLVFPRANAFYHALSADAYRQEGLNAHGIVFDELHAQKNRDLWDTLTYAGASRRQPLLLAITTAGWDRESICWEQRQYAQRVIDNLIEDTSFFAYIAAADEKDDWTDPAVWRKANPSMGVTVKADEFAAACKEAQDEPRKENTFKRYRLNIWTEQAIRWISMAKWDACGGAVDRKALAGRRCFPAFDLSAAKDLTTLVLVFPPVADDEPWKVLPFFWMPRDRAVEKERKDRVPYLTWERQGHITLIPGEVIDYGWIERAILDLGKEFEVPEVAFDPWNASQTANNLMDAGVELIQFRQGYKSMNEPSKEFERLMIAGQLAHGGHPVLRWNAANVCVVEDDAGNIKPSKKHSPERIDGIVATIMGLGRAMLAEGESVYETRGILTL